jgi:hypothetical protein
MSNLAKALVKAQKQFGPALKTSINPLFKSKFASLDSVIAAVIDALNDNGIFLTQSLSDAPQGVTVETIFIHESGEERSMGKITIPVSKQDAQAFGSAATYGRRYSLLAACGIAPEDDDGNAACHPQLPPKPIATAAPVKASGSNTVTASSGTQSPQRTGLTPAQIEQKKQEALAKLRPPNLAPQTQAEAIAMQKGANRD